MHEIGVVIANLTCSDKDIKSEQNGLLKGVKIKTCLECVQKKTRQENSGW